MRWRIWNSFGPCTRLFAIGDVWNEGCFELIEKNPGLEKMNSELFPTTDTTKACSTKHGRRRRRVAPLKNRKPGWSGQPK